ncbi:MAG: DUF6766 family protein [Pyrinomonadaceae bacterium]
MAGFPAGRSVCGSLMLLAALPGGSAAPTSGVQNVGVRARRLGEKWFGDGRGGASALAPLSFWARLSSFWASDPFLGKVIWLRQKGSPESKPVDAPHSQTGKD